jgi:S1-C subfamily serine protease
MKKLIIIIALLFTFSNTTYANVIDNTGKEIEPLKTTDGYLFVNDTIKANIENLKKHTLIVMRQEAEGQYRGAGIAIDKRHILTANHVTSATGKNFYFEHEGSQPIWATVVKQDPTHDIAILEIDKNAPDLIEPMTFATELNIGDTVYTIGHPLSGLYSLTEGSILKLSEKAYNGIESVKLDIKIHDGNSGGFVINDQGELVGMISSGSQVINWGYMIGIEDIQSFLNAEE